MTRYKIRWQYGTYTTTFTVFAEEEEEAFKKARKLSVRQGLRTLPMAYESWEVVEHDQVDEEP